MRKCYSLLLIYDATTPKAEQYSSADDFVRHLRPLHLYTVGYSRNSLATRVNVDVDFRALKMVAIRGGHLDLAAESFKILNHRDVTELNNVFGSSATPARSFASPIKTATPRRSQFSLDYEF